MFTILTVIALQTAISPAIPIPSACPPMPKGLVGWGKPVPSTQGLTIGAAANLTPVTVATVRLAVQPSKPLSGSHLATMGFEVKTAGKYSVAAGGVTAAIRPLWLDVAGADHKPLESVGHGHGPACSSITKVVDFQMAPGRYTLLITGLTGATPVRVLVTPKS